MKNYTESQNFMRKSQNFMRKLYGITEFHENMRIYKKLYGITIYCVIHNLKNALKWAKKGVRFAKK